MASSSCSRKASRRNNVSRLPDSCSCNSAKSSATVVGNGGRQRGKAAHKAPQDVASGSLTPRWRQQLRDSPTLPLFVGRERAVPTNHLRLSPFAFRCPSPCNNGELHPTSLTTAQKASQHVRCLFSFPGRFLSSTSRAPRSKCEPWCWPGSSIPMSAAIGSGRNGRRASYRFLGRQGIGLPPIRPSIYSRISAPSLSSWDMCSRQMPEFMPLSTPTGGCGQMSRTLASSKSGSSS
jgi:hypothetical protein